MSEPLTELPDARLTLDEEAELAKLIRTGDLAARDKLVLHTMREAIAYARRITGGRVADAQLASVAYDVLNRGALRFNSKFGRFFAFCKVGMRGYCVRFWKAQDVVKNSGLIRTEATPWVKAGKTATANNDRDTVEPWDDCETVTPDHEIAEPDFKGIQMRERWDLVKAVMKKCCSLKERQILELAYVAGFNYQEVACFIGVSRAAIQAMASKSLMKIKRELHRKKRLYENA